MALSKNLEVLVPVLRDTSVEFVIEYESPIPAPVRAGQEIGKLIITAGNMDAVTVPLLANTSVPVGGFFSRLITAGQSLLNRIINAHEVAL